MKPNVLPRIALSSLFLIVANSYAEENSELSVGLAYIGGDSIYAGDKFKSAIMPSISYQSDTLSFSFQEGLAYKLFNGEKLELSAAFVPKGRPYDSTDSTDSTDLTGMTRDMYFDGSLNASYEISRGLTAKFKLATELTNKFNGHAADLSVSQFTPIFGQPFVFQAGAKWFGNGRANYLYGVNANEVTGQRAQYAPGSVILPYVSTNTFYSLTEQVSLFANVNVTLLPSNVVDSPIVDRNSSVTTVLGLSYSF
jgi:outer membrane protein